MAEPSEEVRQERQRDIDQGFAPKGLSIWAKKSDPRWLKYFQDRKKQSSGVRGLISSARNKLTGRNTTNPFTVQREKEVKKPVKEKADATAGRQPGILGAVSAFTSGAKKVAQQTVKRMAATKAAAKGAVESAAKKAGGFLGRLFGRK